MKRLVASLVFALLAAAGYAQSAAALQHTLEAALKDKPLLIRDFLASPVIHYTWQTDHFVHGPGQFFALGAFELDSVKVHDSHVTLKGMRGVVLKPDLAAADALSPTARAITIEVDLRGADAAAIAQLPASLFYPDIDAALGAIPPQFVQAVGIRKPGVRMSGGWNGRWFKVDGKWQIVTERVGAPRILYAAEPEFSEEARAKKVGGNVRIAVSYTSDGEVESVWLLRPLGLGLDEQAAKVGLQYRFAPGLLHDQPVGSVMVVEVNFQIF